MQFVLEYQLRSAVRLCCMQCVYLFLSTSAGHVNLILVIVMFLDFVGEGERQELCRWCHLSWVAKPTEK